MKEITERTVVLMNLAEKMFDSPEKKEEYVIKGIMILYPDVSAEEVSDLIDIFIGVSKLSSKILFNIKDPKCNCVIL